MVQFLTHKAPFKTIVAFAASVDQDQATKICSLIFGLHYQLYYNIVDKSIHDIAVIRVRILS